MRPLPPLGYELRVYVEVWVVYLNLAINMDLWSLSLMAMGYMPITLMRSPLTAATSPLDFW